MNHPLCLVMDEWIIKCVTERNFVKTWIQLETMMLSEISPMEEDSCTSSSWSAESKAIEFVGVERRRLVTETGLGKGNLAVKDTMLTEVGGINLTIIFRFITKHTEYSK